MESIRLVAQNVTCLRAVLIAQKMAKIHAHLRENQTLTSVDRCELIARQHALYNQLPRKTSTALRNLLEAVMEHDAILLC